MKERLFTLGISENICKKNGINYYNSNEEYPIRSSSFSSGIGLGINHHTVGWGSKSLSNMDFHLICKIQNNIIFKI